MYLNFIRIPALLFICFPAMASGSGLIKKSTACEALLLAVRPAHITPQMGREQTNGAVNKMRVLRLSVLGVEKSAKPNAKALHVSDRSFSGSIKKAMGRISGVEFDWKRPKEDGDFTRVFAGMLLTGKDEILRYFLEVEGRVDFVLKQIEQFDRDRNFGFSSEKLQLGLASFMTGMIPLEYLFTQMAGVQGFVMLSPLAVWASLVGPETIARYTLNFDYSFWATHNKLLDRVNTPSSKSFWVLESRNYRMPTPIIKDLWFKGYLGKNTHMQSVAENEAYLGKKLRKILGTQGAYRDTHVMVDRLLTYNAKTDEYQLAVIIRSSMNSPKYPQEQAQTESDFAEARDGAQSVVR